MSQILWKEQSEDANTQSSCHYHSNMAMDEKLEMYNFVIARNMKLKKDILFSRNFFWALIT